MSQILNILGSVGFNWHVALANFVNFLIVLAILNVLFFKKIGKAIDDRHNAIEHGLNQAREAEQALLHAEEEKQSIIKVAHKEKEEIVKKATEHGEEIINSLRMQAEHDIQSEKARLHEAELSLKDTVTKAFGEKAPSLVAELYAKTLMKEMSEAENNALIAKMKA
jgi:F-type H+-transporting ATPase subunit b